MRITPTEEAIAEFWRPMSEVDPFGDPKWLSLMVEFTPERRVVGNIGYGVTAIDETHRFGSIGWSLSPAYRRLGIATEAARALLGFLFEHLGVHRVQARTGAANTPSWKLMERLGMRREAHFHESHTNLAGEWDDEFVYAILKKEWDSNPETSSDNH
jgi:RimJ/RimL family protein N-acetyltransferase